MALKIDPRNREGRYYRYVVSHDKYRIASPPWDSDDIWLHDRDFINQSANHNLTSFSL